MNLKRQMDDLRILASSNWVRGGVALQVAAGIVVGLFVVDARWGNGKALMALLFADGIDGSGLAFDAVRYGIMFLTIAGLVCIAVGCAKIGKHRTGLPNCLSG